MKLNRKIYKTTTDRNRNEKKSKRKITQSFVNEIITKQSTEGELNPNEHNNLRTKASKVKQKKYK